jgi:tol-pal system protein YbgF
MLIRLGCVLTLSTALLTSGCATAGGSTSQLESAVYQTHRIVQDLDRNLSGSVTRLSETTAELLARIQSTENETRRLLSVAEENQRRLDSIQQNLEQLTKVLYRQFNLSPPTTNQFRTSPTAPFDTPAPSDSGNIRVRPPVTDPTTSNQPPEIQAPAPNFPQQPVGPSQDEHFQQAQDYYKADDFAAALQQYQDHITKFPQSAYLEIAQYWVGHCTFKMGNYDQAILKFEQFRTAYPAHNRVPFAMHNQAVAYSRIGQNERAKSLFQRLIREYPDDAASESARNQLRQLEGLSQ